MNGKEIMVIMQGGCLVYLKVKCYIGPGILPQAHNNGL